MLRDEIIPAGKLGKPVGRDGAIKLEVEHGFEKLLKKLKFLFVSIEGNFVPFRIKGYHSSQVDAVTFFDINSPEAVNFLTNKLFGIHRSELPSGYHSPSKTNKDTVGYTVIESNHTIGVITAIIKNPGQTLIEVSTTDSKKILIPYVDAFISDINKDRKEITMKLPEGLLDL